MNGPAWHDRFPRPCSFDSDPDGFPGKDEVTRYFEDFAKQIEAPIHCGVEVTGASAQTVGIRLKHQKAISTQITLLPQPAHFKSQ